MKTGPSPYIPLISDYGFKATFGNETDSLFLRTALQALIKSNVPIRQVRFDKNAFEALTVDSRSGIFDLACTDENGSQFIVEMQLGTAPHFIQRMKFYSLHKFNTLVERGGLRLCQSTQDLRHRHSGQEHFIYRAVSHRGQSAERDG